MRQETLRKLFWIGIIVAAVLFAAMLWDYFGNDSDWFVALLVPFIVLIVALLLLLLVRPEEEDVEFVETTTSPVATPGSTTEAYYDFKGDIHDVIDVEGIGPVYAERLQRIGIETTARLCYEDAESVAKRIDVPVKTVRGWQGMAQLMKINGIAKQYAEALVRGGVDGIDELKRSRPEHVAKQVSDYLADLDVHVLGQNVTQRRVQGWQKKAASMRRVRQPIPAS